MLPKGGQSGAPLWKSCAAVGAGTALSVVREHMTEDGEGLLDADGWPIGYIVATATPQDCQTVIVAVDELTEGC